APTDRVIVTVDNGAGHGPATLDRKIAVMASGSGDPFALGVSWGAVFADIAANVSRPALRANGVDDDRAAIQAALNAASASGGGVVELPESASIRIASSLALPNNVVLKGAGKDRTTIKYERLWPINTDGKDRIGL